MSSDKSSGFNIFSVIHTVKPYFHIIAKRWYIAATAACLMGLKSYLDERKISPSFSAQLTYMIEDEVLGTNQQSAGNPLMAAITGQAPTSNKAIMNDLAWSNKLIENTLLKKASIKGKNVLLANYYQQNLGYIQGDNPADAYWFKDTYSIGQDDKLDYRLRMLSNSIKLSFKATTLESGLLKMSFSSNDEQFTKLFLEEHLKTVSEFYISKRMERAANMVRLSTRKRDSLQALLQGKEYGIAAVQDRSFGTVMKRAAVPELQLRRDLTLISAQYTESVAALSAARLELEKKKPFISVVDDIRFPLDAKYPKPLVKAITGLLIGLMIGASLPILFSLGKEQLRLQKEKYLAGQQGPF